MKAQRSGESGVSRRVASCSAGEGRQQSLTPVTLQSRIVINNVVSACVQSVQSVQIVARQQQAGRGEGEGERCCVLWVGLVGLRVGWVAGWLVGLLVVGVVLGGSATAAARRPGVGRYGTCTGLRWWRWRRVWAEIDFSVEVSLASLQFQR